MKYDCEVIQDLMPLEIDGIASGKSIEIIDKHKKECKVCSQYYDYISCNLNIDTEMTNEEQKKQENKQIATYRSRIKRRRIKIIIGISAGVVALLLVQAIVILCAIGSLTIFGEEYSTTDVTDYGIYNGHIEAESKGRFSHLFIFPEKLSKSAQIEDYYYYCSNKGLDNSYQIFLEYKLSTEDFKLEKNRLANISSNYKNKTNEVIYDTTSFDYPAYITVFNHNGTYEYALIDETNKRIICVYTQFRKLKKVGREESYLPTTSSIMGDEGYSVYYFPAGNNTLVMPDIDEVD